MLFASKIFSPNEEARGWLGLKYGEKYCIIRFVSWKATHDIGEKGFSPEDKIQLVKRLTSILRVFITSQEALPEAFQQYQIKIPPQLLHHALAFAEIVISEGATIASESGLLGSPAIYCSTIASSYLEDQEKYGTVYNYRSGNGIFQKIEKIMQEDKKLFKVRSEKLLSDKIDVTAFMVWFVENYPQSFRTMKEDPDYQLKFK